MDVSYDTALRRPERRKKDHRLSSTSECVECKELFPHEEYGFEFGEIRDDHTFTYTTFCPGCGYASEHKLINFQLVVTLRVQR